MGEGPEDSALYSASRDIDGLPINLSGKQSKDRVVSVQRSLLSQWPKDALVSGGFVLGAESPTTLDKNSTSKHDIRNQEVTDRDRLATCLISSLITVCI
jgi:hypothetical protein